AVMDGLQRFIGLRGHDGAAIEFVALAVHPLIPDRRHGEGRAILAADEPGLFRPRAFRLPFIKAGNGHKRAAMAESAPERRLLDNCFSTGIDENGLRHLLCPGRHKPPAHQQKMARALLFAIQGTGDDRHRLRRRDIVAGRKIRRFDEAEKRAHRLWRQGNCVSSTHRDDNKPSRAGATGGNVMLYHRLWTKGDVMVAQDASHAHQTHNHRACIEDALATARELCAERGVQLTPLREKVLQIVWKSHKPVGAYDVLDELARSHKSARPPTVYRALDFLIAEGLIHKIESLNAYLGCVEAGAPHSGQFLI